MYTYKIEIDNSKNINSNGHETWIYGIKSELEECIISNESFDIISNGFELRKTNDYNVSMHYLGQTPLSSIEFSMKGEVLEFLCLNHGWSGTINIYKNNNMLLNVDLFRKDSRLIELSVDTRSF